MTKEDMDKVIELIEQRKVDVLAANNVPEGDIQHAWISGIYEDIKGFLKSQFE
jgi:hypothetical protein